MNGGSTSAALATDGRPTGRGPFNNRYEAVKDGVNGERSQNTVKDGVSLPGIKGRKNNLSSLSCFLAIRFFQLFYLSKLRSYLNIW